MDARLRKLERDAFSSKDPASIAAYYAACLQSREIPKHFVHTAKNKPFGVWSIYYDAYSKDVSGGRYPRILDWHYPDWDPCYSIVYADGSHRGFYLIEQLPAKLNYLIKLFENGYVSS